MASVAAGRGTPQKTCPCVSPVFVYFSYVLILVVSINVGHGFLLPTISGRDPHRRTRMWHDSAPQPLQDENYPYVEGDTVPVGPSTIHKFHTLPRLYVGPPTVPFHDPGMNANLRVGSKGQLTPDQTHYLTRVLRLVPQPDRRRNVGREEELIDVDSNSIRDDPSWVRIFDGRSGEWLARLVLPTPAGGEDERDGRGPKRQRRRNRSSLPDVCWFECTLCLRNQTNDEDPGVPVGGPAWVLFAPIQDKTRLRTMVEKCTELGAARMIPVQTDRTQRSRDGGRDNRYEKLQVVAVEAAEQSERLTVPIVGALNSPTRSGDAYDHGHNDNPPELGENGHGDGAEVRLVDLLAEWMHPQPLHKSGGTFTERLLLICRERSDDVPSLLYTLNQLHEGGPTKLAVAFLVGPEGGWSPEEESLFDEYGRDRPDLVRSVSLGTAVLRSETAAMVAMATWTLWGTTFTDNINARISPSSQCD